MNDDFYAFLAVFSALFTETFTDFGPLSAKPLSDPTSLELNSSPKWWYGFSSSEIWCGIHHVGCDPFLWLNLIYYFSFEASHFMVRSADRLLIHRIIIIIFL